MECGFCCFMRPEMIAFFILFYGNKIHYQIDILPKDVLYKLVPVKIGGHDYSQLIRWQNQQFGAFEFVY